ncbi:MAG: hypothetical protein LAT64_13280 [Phycisphaerales bacterium]|nr:hypothetical protein [Planctomycetota bacterium]MCH8509727.1 hypothetical protein [Phycisphaerales bacterium]
MKDRDARAPYPTGLIDLIKPRMTPKLVRYIADADFLKSRVIEHLVQSPRIISPLDDRVIEALSLVKWDDPEDRSGDNPKKFTTRELHISRLFCCACLLSAYSESKGHESEPSEVLPRLIESTIAVEQAWLGELKDLIVWARDWCDQADPTWHEHETDATLCRMALMIIAAASKDRVDQVDFARAVDEIFERKQRSFARRIDRWTWILEDGFFRQSVHLWKSLADRYLLTPPNDWTEEAKAAARRLGNAMIRDESTPPL